MAKFQSILETIGKTPLIQMPGITRGLGAEPWFKLEFFNPLSSVKDRIASAMIAGAELRAKSPTKYRSDR
jgi:cysteine synthase A